MNSRDLSVRQLDALFDNLRAMAFYLGKLRQRMEASDFRKVTNWRPSFAKPRRPCNGWCSISIALRLTSRDIVNGRTWANCR